MFNLNNFKNYFFYVYNKLQNEETYLNKLDTAIGDGDHGSTILRGFCAVVKSIDRPFNSISELFEFVANTLAEQTGGAIGPLLASFFGEGVYVFYNKENIGIDEMVDFFRQGLFSIKATGGAEPGDKTLVDSLTPAYYSLVDNPRLSLEEALKSAAKAAEMGAHATSEMKANEGRARFLGNRTKGHQDPGATSFSMLVQAFSDIANGISVDKPIFDTEETTTVKKKTGKFLNSIDSMIREDKEGLISAYPSLVSMTESGVLVRTNKKNKGKVGLAIGQGGGHTPSMGGFIGHGLLDANVIGPLFTCASGLRIADAISEADQGAGVALLVSNHAGDVLNARLAQNVALKAGHDVEFIKLSDDVSSAPRENFLRRRGLGGLLFALKIGGGAAEEGLSLKNVASLMRSVNERTSTLGVSSRPPRHPVTGDKLFDLPSGQIEVGTGVHGEVGVYRGELLSADDLVTLLLEKLMPDLEDFLQDRVWVFLNGCGGTSQMELHILYRSIYKQLNAKGLMVQDGVIGSYFTTLEMGGFSLSLCALPKEAEPFWDLPALSAAFQWPKI